MSRFAVGYINFFDNELVIEIIEADHSKEALHKHSQIGDAFRSAKSLDEAKAAAWDQDSVIEVVAIP